MLRVTLHFAKPADVSALNVLGRLDIGVDKLAARANYRGVLRTSGMGPLPAAILLGYPRWSASVWDLVVRMICLCLHGDENILPEGTPLARRAAFIDDLTVVVEDQSCEGETPIRVVVGTAHIAMAARCHYVARFDDPITGEVNGPMFMHAPEVFNFWDLVTRAYAWCSTRTFVLAARPRLCLPRKADVDEQSLIPIDSLRQPARTGISVWLTRHNFLAQVHPAIAGPCVSATQFAEFLAGLPRPTREPNAVTKDSAPKRQETYRPGKRRTSRATRRKSQGRSGHRGALDLAQWSKLRCLRHLATLRWGSDSAVVCPHCNCATIHYWSGAELRWKCRHCGSRFSVTSDTVFANRRISLQAILLAAHAWSSGASGLPAMQLQGLMGSPSYNTAFVLMGKLREALVRGFNTGTLEGTVEIDGAHASGKRSAEKRGSPMRFNKGKDDPPWDSSMLTHSARSRQRRADKKAGKTAETAYPLERRIVMALRQRSGQHNHGASSTRIGVWTSEHPEAVRALVEKFVSAPPSVLATDTGTAYSQIGARFGRHDQVNHSERFVGPDGQHNNNAESFTTRLDRGETGVHIHRESKYLTDYAVETAFREDHRELSTGARADCALQFALNVGLSKDWRGYSQGRRREHEITARGTAPASTHGYYRKKSPGDTLEWPVGLDL